MEPFRRSDIRASLIGSDSVAPGVAVELVLTLVDAGSGCAPLAGHALYLWQNDAGGKYSLYDLPEESYLRGVQVADAQGQVRFTTIFPGCYGGRYPHLHFEVFASLDEASGGGRPLLTSQLALPAEECTAVYADAGTYGQSMANLERTSISRDFIFRDNAPPQMEAMTLEMRGSAGGGYAASATIGIAV
jgi:protocatechuate 3,4-dioxygenase beta subunit